jgi:hypothetical protein
MSIAKRNIFKSDKSDKPDRNIRREQKDNKFKLNDEKKIEANIPKDSDFPELIMNKTYLKKDENQVDKLDYKIASLKEVVKEDEVYKLPEGWVSFQYSENKEIQIEPHDSFYELDETREEFHMSASHVFDRLIQKWELYKNNYNNMYGNDEYERLYDMPNYEYYVDNDELDINVEMNIDY